MDFVSINNFNTIHITHFAGITVKKVTVNCARCGVLHVINLRIKILEEWRIVVLIDLYMTNLGGRA